MSVYYSTGESDTGTYDYAYDYRTRRVSRTEPATGQTQVVFDGGSSIIEYGASVLGAPNVEYVRGHDYGGGVGGLEYSLRSGAPSYNFYDSRGDVTTQTSSTGSVTFQTAYEAFGNQTTTEGSTPDRQKASTKEQDPTGLLNEGFRYRDPSTGAFLTRDPLGFKAGPNMYTYVHQNPWTHFDPEGLDNNPPPPPPPPPPSQHAPPTKQTTTPPAAPAQTSSQPAASKNSTTSPSGSSPAAPAATGPTFSFNMQSQAQTAANDAADFNRAAPSAPAISANVTQQQSSRSAATPTQPPRLSHRAEFSIALGVVELVSAYITAYTFSTIVLKAARKNPFAPAILAIAGAEMVHSELSEGFENIGRGMENKGPALGPFHPFGD